MGSSSRSSDSADYGLTVEESKELLALCRAGKLYAVENWIRSRKSIEVAGGVRQTPIQIAFDNGFHSLIELLIRSETTLSGKNRALQVAVANRSLEFIELAVELGAETSVIALIDVLRSWEPRIMRYFLARGADVVTNEPFVIAFFEKIRTALRVFREHMETHPEVAASLKRQADKVLRHFSADGNLKWVSLMLWAGADPRSRGPLLDTKFPDDPQCDSTALEEAAILGHVDVLRRFKLTAADPLSSVLERAARFANRDAVQYLLSLGAKPNNKANGGSSALDGCLLHLEFEGRNIFNRKAKIGRYSVYRTMETIKILVAAGAIWRLDDQRTAQQLQRTLLNAEPELAIDLFKIFKEGGACAPAEIMQFLQRPKMRSHLAEQQWHLTRLGIPKPPSPPTVPWHLLARFDREKLYQEVWTVPMQKLSLEYGVSDVALAKTCRKLSVPTPGRGYWARLTAGKPVGRRPTLPELPVPRQVRPEP